MATKGFSEPANCRFLTGRNLHELLHFFRRQRLHSRCVRLGVPAVPRSGLSERTIQSYENLELLRRYSAVRSNCSSKPGSGCCNDKNLPLAGHGNFVQWLATSA